jgi:hypothetical protein
MKRQFSFFFSAAPIYAIGFWASATADAAVFKDQGHAEAHGPFIASVHATIDVEVLTSDPRRPVGQQETCGLRDIQSFAHSSPGVLKSLSAGTPRASSFTSRNPGLRRPAGSREEKNSNPIRRTSSRELCHYFGRFLMPTASARQ